MEQCSVRYFTRGLTQCLGRWREQQRGEAVLAVLEEDGESFVEARGHGCIGRSGECYRVLISDIKMRVQACGLVDAQQK